MVISIKSISNLIVGDLAHLRHNYGLKIDLTVNATVILTPTLARSERFEEPIFDSSKTKLTCRTEIKSFLLSTPGVKAQSIYGPRDLLLRTR